MKKIGISFCLLVGIASGLLSQNIVTTGPEKGSLVIVGGGRNVEEISLKFIVMIKL